MKKLYPIILILLFGISQSFSQEIRDFGYIIVPEKFSGFDKNEYKLNYYLKTLLKKKNYTILSDQKETWPPEVQLDNCLALTSDAKKDKSFFKNRIEITFKDCKGNQVETFHGISSIKEFEKGYQDAMRIATQTIGLRNPNANQSIKSENSVVENPTQTVQDEANLNQNLYSDGEFTYTKSDLADGTFLLIRQDNAKVFAQFFPSSRTDVYHVKLIGDQSQPVQTIGFWDGNKFQLEIPTQSNKWITKEFKKSY